jgi:hypothetical protein
LFMASPISTPPFLPDSLPHLQQVRCVSIPCLWSPFPCSRTGLGHPVFSGSCPCSQKRELPGRGVGVGPKP